MQPEIWIPLVLFVSLASISYAMHRRALKRQSPKNGYGMWAARADSVWSDEE